MPSNQKKKPLKAYQVHSKKVNRTYLVAHRNANKAKSQVSKKYELGYKSLSVKHVEMFDSIVEDLQRPTLLAIAEQKLQNVHLSKLKDKLISDESPVDLLDKLIELRQDEAGENRLLYCYNFANKLFEERGKYSDSSVKTTYKQNVVTVIDGLRLSPFCLITESNNFYDGEFKISHIIDLNKCVVGKLKIVY